MGAAAPHGIVPDERVVGVEQRPAAPRRDRDEGAEDARVAHRPWRQDDDDACREQRDLAREDLLELVQELWRPGYHELRSLAIALLELYSDKLRATDMARVEQLLRDSDGWAHVDWLSIRVAGPLVERRVSAERRLSRWAKDGNFWIRRAAMLALLEPLRRGEGVGECAFPAVKPVGGFFFPEERDLTRVRAYGFRPRRVVRIPRQPPDAQQFVSPRLAVGQFAFQVI